LKEQRIAANFVLARDEESAPMSTVREPIETRVPRPMRGVPTGIAGNHSLMRGLLSVITKDPRVSTKWSWEVIILALWELETEAIKLDGLVGQELYQGIAGIYTGSNGRLDLDLLIVDLLFEIEKEVGEEDAHEPEYGEALPEIDPEYALL